jgi:hypothetical protein
MSMVIAAWADQSDTVAAYRHALPRLGALSAELEDHRELWAEEDDQLTASERAIDSGAVRIDQHPEVDLAVVTTTQPDPPHEMAVHNRTPHLRVATVRGRHLELAYRYETWVRLRSRTPMPRVDLSGLAARLTALEPDGVEWNAEPVDALTPRLAPVPASGSDLDATVFVAEVRRWLAAAAVTWSPD